MSQMNQHCEIQRVANQRLRGYCSDVCMFATCGETYLVIVKLMFVLDGKIQFAPWGTFVSSAEVRGCIWM